MAELEDMINSVLSDPEQMSKIAGLAQSLMGGESSSPSQPPFDQKAMGIMQKVMGGDSKPGCSEALLRAMQPYMSEKRRLKMDKALRLAKMAKLAGFAMEELGGDNK